MKSLIVLPCAWLVVCSLHCFGAPSALDAWRLFVESTRLTDQSELPFRFAELRKDYRSNPADITRLKLAYLMSQGITAMDDAEAMHAEAQVLLLEMNPAHELAPLRDGLLRELRLKRELRVASRQLQSVGAECEASSEQLMGLRLNHARMQGELNLCLEQLQALKQIENTMSAPVEDTDVPRR